MRERWSRITSAFSNIPGCNGTCLPYALISCRSRATVALYAGSASLIGAAAASSVLSMFFEISTICPLAKVLVREGVISDTYPLSHPNEADRVAGDEQVGLEGKAGWNDPAPPPFPVMLRGLRRGLQWALG